MKKPKIGIERRLEMVQSRIQSNLDGLENDIREAGVLREQDMDDLGLCVWEAQLMARQQGLEDARRWIGWVLDPSSLE